jgi:hypothetical protein
VVASEPGAVVVPPAPVAGETYAQWFAASWQWFTAHGRSHDASDPEVTPCISSGQHGPVWFLNADSYRRERSTKTVTCSVPAGRYLFLSSPSIECSTVEPAPFHATTPAGLRRCATSFPTPAGSLTLDGSTLTAGFRFVTQAIAFSMPASHNVLEVRGQRGGKSVLAGYPVMLAPLAPGVHTLVRVVVFGPGTRSELRHETTWKITVG